MKKTTLNTLLLIFTIVVPISAFSQKNLFPGYIISLNGDTVKGYIKYKNWEYNPDQISFWEKRDGEAVIYNPGEIKMFGVEGDEYISAFVRYDDSSQKLETLSTDSVFNYQSDTLFLLVLAIGEKSLFYFNDKNERKKFFVKTDTAYTWLEFRKYLNKHEDGLMDMVTVNGYIIQLAKYLDDCQKISHKISKAEYNPEYLTSLFKDYYKCTSQTNASIKGINKKPLEFGVLAGATLTNVVFKSKSDEAVYKTDFSTSTNFTFGMKIEAFLPRGFNRWSFNNEILFTNYTVNGYFEDYIDENKYSKSKASVGFLHLRMSNMLRYTYALGKFSVFVNAGITNGMTLARTDQVTTEIKLYSSARTVTEELFGDTQGWEFGFNLGLGTKWKRISFEYRYKWGSSFIGYGNHSSATHRNYFLLGYAF